MIRMSCFRKWMDLTDITQNVQWWKVTRHIYSSALPMYSFGLLNACVLLFRNKFKRENINK